MGNNGTLTGSPTFAAAATGFGNAITLDGATQYVTLPTLVDMTAVRTWTVEARIKTADSGNRLLWVIGDPTSSDGCMWLGINGGKLLADFSSPNGVAGTATVNDGVERHVVMVITDTTPAGQANGVVTGTVALYVNGVYDNSSATTMSWTPAANSPFFLGYWTAAGARWNGSIDEAAFSRVAQYTGSTYTVPTAPLAANRTGQVALYRMDETTGATTIADSNTYVTASTPTPTPTPTITITPAAGQFWDDGYANPTANYVQTSEFARLVVKTDATSVAATVYTDGGGFAPLSAVGVRVNGLASGETTLECNQAGVSTFTVPLPGVAGTTVEFVNGQAQIVTGTSNWTGTYFTSLAFAGATAATVVPPAATNKWLVYGDSIEGGGPNVTSPFQAWTEQERIQYPGDVQVEAYGGRALHNDCPTPAATTAFAARLAGYNPSRVVGCIGVNDYLNAPWTAAQFAAAYGSMWDQFHAAKPTVPVSLVTPLVKASEVANSAGDTLGAYRTAITALGTTRPWMTVVDGSAVLTPADLGSDGTHPNLAAQTTKLPAFYLGVVTTTAAPPVPSTINVTPATLPAGAGQTVTVSGTGLTGRFAFGGTAGAVAEVTGTSDLGSAGRAWSIAVLSGSAGTLTIADAAGPAATVTVTAARPTQPTVAPANASAAARWLAAAGASAYRLYRTPVGGAAAKVYDGPLLAFADAGLANGTAYAYTLTAVDGGGDESPPSPPAVVTPSVPDYAGTGTAGEYTRAAAVAPSDAVDLPFVSDAIVVGSAGTVQVQTTNSPAPVPVAFAAGVPQAIRATRVYATGTTAGSIVIQSR